MKNERIWTKEYILLMASNFFVAVNFYILMSTSANFAIRVLGTNETQAGFGAGVFVMGSLISRIIVSRYSAMFGFKKTLLIGIGALIVFTVLLFPVNSFAGFCIVRFCGGLTFGVNTNTLVTVMAHIIPDNRKGEGVGWFSLSQIIGMALGPYFAVSIMHTSGFRDVFLLATLVAAAAFLVIVFIKFPESLKQATSAEIPSQGAVAPIPQEQGIWQFFERSAVKFAILCFVLYICNSNYVSFVAIYVTESGAANLSSLIFIPYAVAMFIMRPVTGKIFDKYGPNQLLVFGFIVNAAGFFLLGLGIVEAFLPSALLLGFGISTLQGATIAVVVSEAPRRRLAIANATYYFSFDLGAAIGPVFGGRLIEQAGYGTMYYVCGAIAILCLPLYFGVLTKVFARKSNTCQE